MIWPEKDSHHLVVSADQMKNIEKKIFSNGMSVAALMEKVGLQIASWLLERPTLLQKSVIILVGPGHNGGDGLVVARELHFAGVDVSVWCPYPIQKELTKQYLTYSDWIGIPKLAKPPDPASDCLWIESIFGLGQKKPLSKELQELFKSRNELQPDNLISIDVPAGICSDSGELLSDYACQASYTLTVGLIKQGLIQDKAIKFVGKIKRIDLGLVEKLLINFSPSQTLRLTFDDLKTFTFPLRDKASSKYQNGRILLIAGSKKYLGAAAIALKGALASGVGSINAALPQVMADMFWADTPEVVVSNILEPSLNGGSLIKKALEENDLDRFDSILIGPGLGGGEDWDEFGYLLEGFKGFLLLDADGLNRLSASSKGWKWLRKRKSLTCITPHLNEFQKLFPDIDVSMPLAASMEASAKTNAVVLLKGAHSVISAPSGQNWQITETCPNVARAGLGDLLAGFLSGMGAIGVSSKSGLSIDLLTASALMHAQAAFSCVEGSNASPISVHLAKMTKSHMTENVAKETSGSVF